MSETGWLIEAWNPRTNTFGASWWSLTTENEDELDAWSPDSDAALRFARQQDAQAYIDATGWTDARPTEHAWVGDGERVGGEKAYLRPEVLAFAHLMEAQLKANDHKPGWKGEDWYPLLMRMREETIELHEALIPGSRTDLPAWWKRVGSEAADVANFAMMIADVCGALTTPPAEGPPGAAEPVAWTGRLHDLKTWPEFFEAVEDGRKTFEVRVNDRDYQVGDGLLLREWSPETKDYSGRAVTRIVSYLVTDRFGVDAKHVIMGLASPPLAVGREEIDFGEIAAAAFHKIVPESDFDQQGDAVQQFYINFAVEVAAALRPTPAGGGENGE